MEGIPDGIAQLARALRPQGLWFAASTVLLGLIIWAYQDVTFNLWPPPLRYFSWGWFIAWCLAVPYMHWTSRAAAISALSVRAEKDEANGPTPPSETAPVLTPHIVTLPQQGQGSAAGAPSTSTPPHL
jgi:hypothetical protein